MQVAFDTPINTSDQSVDRVIKTGMPLLFVFAESPVTPVLTTSIQNISRQNTGDLLVVQVTPSENPETVRRMGVGRPPALVTWRDGKVLSRAEGISADDLQKHAAYLLGRGSKPESARTYATDGQAPGRPGNGAASTQGDLVNATDGNFERLVLGASQPVLVDFWAPWCGPCRMTNPIVEKLARELGSKLTVAKVNVDENPRLSASYGVASIPTMMIVNQGQVVDRWAGAMPEGNIRSRLQRYLS
jgi:thioredoxin 1